MFNPETLHRICQWNHKPGSVIYQALVFMVLAFPAVLKGQTIKIAGKVMDKSNHVPLPGAIITVYPLNTGTASDSSGSYHLNLPAADSLIFEVEYLGYQKLKHKTTARKSKTLDFTLTPAEETLEEVVVTSNVPQESLKSTQMGVVSVEAKDAKLIPVFFGEVDLLKTIQLKPGIQGGNEGNSGIYVRGGGPDQNLILLDNTIVYNPSHLLGFFSLFNPDVVKSVDLYKADFPAQYGGRLSSVVDMKLAEGNKEKYHVQGGVGLISSRLSLEGPLKKNIASFIVSARRTYLDLYTPTINRINKDKKDFDPIPRYYFYDLNARADWNIGPNDKISFSGYFGNDLMDLSTSNFNSVLEWGNTVASVKWKHAFNSKLIVNNSISYSQYYYTINYRFNIFSNTLKTMISEYSLKSDFEYYPHAKHAIRFGGATSLHQFNIGRVKSSNDGNISVGEGSLLKATSGALYFSDQVDISARWKANAGLRYSFFYHENNLFGGAEPRVSVRYLINNRISLKTSYSRMYQYIHLASNSGASLPNDIWFPANNDNRPQKSDQVSSGIHISLWGGDYQLSNELYYKWMARQIDIKEGAAIFDLPNLKEGFTTGKGWAYGNEVYLEKKNGKTTGWVGYTLSWTWRQFAEINDGQKFPARYDRRHNVAVVAMHKISDRLQLSASWTFATGNAITLPIGRFAMQDIDYVGRDFVPQFMARNSFRMPDVHRLDLGLVWKLKPKNGVADVTFSVYNAYSRRNAYFIYFEGVPNGSNALLQSFAAKQVSLFPVIPSVSYNFKF